MTGIKESTRRYEAWLRDQLGDEMVEADLARKHGKMRNSPFVFLRATYWRWAETILAVCSDVADRPPILAIGDTHLENFGTWRDVDGRLVWGANDFDDAAIMPYPLDLIRLAASALLASDNVSVAEVCEALWTGYLRGLAAPEPVILERDHRWLREAILLPEKERAKWWGKFDAAGQVVPPRFRAALAAALPDPATPITTFARSAGTGSLGKPRYVAVATWRGGPVVRECKAVLPSAWGVFGQGAPGPILAGAIAGAATRAIDPHYRVGDGLIVRRLSPNSRKIEVEDAGALLLSAGTIETMGREIATCHAGDVARIDAVRSDSKARDADWLKDRAHAAAEAVRRDFEAFA